MIMIKSKIKIGTRATKRGTRPGSRGASNLDRACDPHNPNPNPNPDRNRNPNPNRNRICNRRSLRGFTLIELLAVMIIIGLILSLVLVAAMDATNRANERATQALIAKLDAGVSDRLEALLQYRPQPNFTHGHVAAIFNTVAVTPTNPLGMLPQVQPQQATTVVQENPAVRNTDRAQVIAWYDYIKSELPDVFFVRNYTPGQHDYPLSFAGVYFPGAPIDQYQLGNYILPIGHMLSGPLIPTGAFGDSYFVNSPTGPVLVSTFPNLGV